MLISKTNFKEYTRCPRVIALANIYKHRLSDVDANEVDSIRELLGSMFNEAGDDLISKDSTQTNALLEYYEDVEKHAINYINQKFDFDIEYSQDTRKQRRFSYTDKNDNEYYCYVDGYFETETEVFVFEVKATTANKFYRLGPKRKESIDNTTLGQYNSIFKYNGDILTLKQQTKSDLTPKQYEQHYNKLLDRYSDVGKYAFDIAVERFIIDRSFFKKNKDFSKKINYYLVVLNSDYVFDGFYDESGPVYRNDHNNNDLFTIINMNQITKDYQKMIKDMQEELLISISKLDSAPVSLGRFCERNRVSGCDFVNVCWEESLRQGSILEYFYQHFGFLDEDGVRHKTIDLINSGRTRLDSIPKSWLSRRDNQIQRECFEENSEYFDIEKIKLGLSLIKYPVYHLDFESFNSPLPRFKGEKPYSQSVFQYSVHIEKSPGVCDMVEDNKYYLSKNHCDNRRELVEKLINDIDLSNGGTVLVYNQTFEIARINEFIELFPEYAKELKLIKSHIFDLMFILKSNSKLYTEYFDIEMERAKLINYYHNDLQGSYSLKKVLPVFSDLSYSELNVENGIEALTTYATYHIHEEEDLENIYLDLIKYCRLDTWSMFIILQKLYSLVNK